jgi:type I restriction enzyme, S subunit
MPSEWRELSVAEIAASVAIGPFGSRMKSDRYVPAGVPVVRGTNLQGSKGFRGEFVYVSQATAYELRSCCVYPGDLVFPHRGAVGEVGIVVGEQATVYMLSTSMMKLTCDPKLADPLFMYYYFRSRGGRHELLKNASQVGTPGIATPLTSLKSARVLLPSLPVQRSVARILGALDDKIELNRKTNETLEQMARALFKSWFVDFEPFRDKGMIDSPLGKIPKGWQTGRLSDLVVLAGGGTPKTSEPEYWDGGIPWYSVEDAPPDGDVFVIETERSITNKGLAESSTRLLPRFTTIISARGTVGRCALTGVEMAMNQSCYGAKGADGHGDFFTYFSVRRAVGELQQMTHGAVFDTITRDTFKAIEVAAPPPAVTRQFDAVVSPYLQRVLGNLRETRTLAAIRDALLPKLMSGEVRVAS